MKNLALAAWATLSLSACSTEPSDWRPESKVSLDMVAPGTRTSDNYDQHTEAAPHQAKGGAIAEPISSAVPLEKQGMPTADQARSANSEEVLRTHSDSSRAKVNANTVQADDEAGEQKAQH